MKIVHLNARRRKDCKLNAPDMIELLWRIANEQRPDPVMRGFVDCILAAIEELMALRALAHQAMIEHDDSLAAAPARNGPAAGAVPAAPDAPAHR